MRISRDQRVPRRKCAGKGTRIFGGVRLRAMAQPARRSAAREKAPPLDPAAVTIAYRRERARRRARIERSREQRRALLRFWLALVFLLTAALLLSLTIWNEVVDLFGPLSPFG
jgi:hypothetical protein